MMAEKPFKTVSEALAPTPFTLPATRALVEQYGTPFVLEYENELASRILELEHDILVLKTCRNSNRPVNRLPAEVLSHVFLVLSWTMQAEASEDQKVFWIHATHVCRHWRAVALGCAALWCDFAFDIRGALMRTILPRSKNLPISVSLKCDGATDTEALGEVLSHTTRIRHLNLSPRVHPQLSWQSSFYLRLLDRDANRKYNPLSYEFALQSMGPSAPLLQTLSVSYATLTDDECLPKHFLKDGAPALKYLKLKNFDLHWARIPFSPALTTLHLGQSISAHPKFAEMLESFRGLPLLERLTLYEMFPEDEYLPIPGMEPVMFSNLKYLSLTDWGPMIGNFLLGIRVPKTAFIDLKFTGPSEEGDWSPEVDECVQCIRSLWRDDPSEWVKDSIESMSVVAVDDSHLTFTFRFLDAPVPLTKNHRDCDMFKPHLAVRFPLSPASLGNPELEFLVSFKQHFNLLTLSSLYFTGMSQLARYAVLMDTFAHLPVLETIRFSKCDMRDFLAILDDYEPSTTNASLAEPSFPALICLEIDAQHFEGNTIDTIVRVLEGRPEGHQVSSLSIANCINIDEKDVEKIKEALPNLYTFLWDKKVTKDKPPSNLEHY
ncbi:hypothetical protein DFP72DRAFT_1175940 [Ephemerocybe angulata]|uniref:F-box domain-containing protein n=1 Tax=Ephemerocybe angulata TaxID=980116 RepID=A0A8H6HF72_9AGAR|nr:hypothetical protein DFP72DRAFT_1175940 [Tulosesus angulatus]